MRVPPKKRNYTLPADFTPQFGPRPISAREKKRIHKTARRGAPYVPDWRLRYQPIRQYNLADAPLNYDEYLRSPYWLILRAEVLATRDHCEECGIKYRLNLHHRYYYHEGNSVLYHERDYPDVFTVLCYPCHMKHHGT